MVKTRIMKAILTIAVAGMLLTSGTNNFRPEQIAAQNNAFAFDLYRQISDVKKGNLFISPFSISTALSMTYAGAAGGTAKEMQDALHFGGQDKAFHTSYGNYLQTLDNNAEGRIKLRIANRLWLEKTYPLSTAFIDLNKEAYDAPVEFMNFIEKPDSERQKINSWVANKTENKILDLIPGGAINTDTRLVLTNAIYFKGDWKYQFKEKKTKDRTFYMTETSKKKTPFMNMEGAFDFFENKQFKMIRLPYKGDKHSMVVVLPNHHGELREVEQSFSASDFDKVFRSYQPDVILSFPKFEMTLPLSLSSNLKALGMKSAFTDSGDFSGMTERNDLYISDVIHKAFIEVNEEGTEAAAATAVIMQIESVGPHEPPKPKEFIADHPFLFYIIDDETKAILFMGRMTEPVL